MFDVSGLVVRTCCVYISHTYVTPISLSILLNLSIHRKYAYPEGSLHLIGSEYTKNRGVQSSRPLIEPNLSDQPKSIVCR